MLHTRPSTMSIIVYTTSPLIDSLLCTNNLNDLGLMKNPLTKICVSLDANLDINIMKEIIVKNYT